MDVRKDEQTNRQMDKKKKKKKKAPKCELSAQWTC